MPMRVMHVNKYVYRRGGAEGYMLDIAALQRQEGDVVALWGMQHPENDPSLPLSDTFATNVELEPPPGGLAGVGAAARMLWSPSSRTSFERALAQFEPDVVHCHNIYHQLSPSILVATKRADIPCVMTLHDYKLVCPSYQMLDHGRPCDACVGHSTLNAARRRCKGGSLSASTILAVESGLHRMMGAYDRVDRFISPSHFLADTMVRGGLDRDRIEVISNVVDLSDVVPADRAGSGVTFAGRLSHEKGVDVLVRAMALTPEGLHLNVAGDGPERAALESLAAEVAPGRVTFHGRLAGSDLRPLVAGSLATVVPSTWYENQPMTILESYAAAVPVVVSDLGGMPELVTDQVHGRVVPPGDPAALAAVLTSLHLDPERAHEMGLAGRARLDAEFAPAEHLRLVRAAYATAAGRHPTATSRGAVA